MPHEAGARDASGRFDAPFRRGCGDEPRPGRGARLLEEDARAAHRRGAARPHLPVGLAVDQVAMGGGVLDLDLGEVAFQLLGDDHRHRRQHALAHFGFGDSERDRIVGIDDHERVDFVARGAVFRAPRLAGDCRRPGEFGRDRGDHQATGGGKARANENTAGEHDCHGGSPFRSSSVRRRGGSPRACAGRSRSGRYWSSRRRCPRRSDGDCAKGARPRP